MPKEKSILITNKSNQEWVEEKKKLLVRFERERGLFVETLETKEEENRTFGITLDNLNKDRRQDQIKIKELEDQIKESQKGPKDKTRGEKEDIILFEKQKEQYEETIKQEKKEREKVEQEKKELSKKNSELEDSYKEIQKELTKVNEQFILKQNENKKLTEQIDQLKSTDIISSTPTITNKEKEQLQKVIKEKDDKITNLTEELKVTRESCIYLNGLLETIEGKQKGKIKWSSNRDTFIDIITKTLPADRIKEELGDIYQGWIEDSVFEILTREDKGKINAWDSLQKQGLPSNWQELIAKGLATSGGSSSGGTTPIPSPNDSTVIIKPSTNQWEIYFPSKQPQDARKEYDKALNDIGDLKGQVKKLNDKLQKIKEYENSNWEN